MTKPILFTLNRRLVSDTSDVCFSVNLHYMLSGRDSDVWTSAFRRLVPVVLVFLGFGSGFWSERFLRTLPTFVACLFTIVDHSIMVLMDFYSFHCYDPLFRIASRFASSIDFVIAIDFKHFSNNDFNGFYCYKINWSPQMISNHFKYKTLL